MRAILYLGLLMALAGGCGTSEPAPAGEVSVIGVEGGSLTFERATLDVPAGALTAAAPLRITTATVAEAAFAYRFDPVDLRFVVPAHLSLREVPPAARVFESSNGGAPEQLAVTWASGAVHVDLTHLGIVYVVLSADGGSDAAVGDADVGDGGADADVADVADASDAGPPVCNWRWGDLPSCGYQAWQSDVPQLYYVNPINRGIPINDPKGEVALVSGGVDALFAQKPLYLTKTGPQTYVDPSNSGWVSVTVSGGMMTLSVSGARTFSGTPPCNPVPLKIETECTGTLPEPPPAL